MPSELASRWFNCATNGTNSVTGTSRMIRQLCTEGRLKWIQPDPSRSHGRGFLWVGTDAPEGAKVLRDIEDRISKTTQFSHPPKSQDA